MKDKFKTNPFAIKYKAKLKEKAKGRALEKKKK